MNEYGRLRVAVVGGSMGGLTAALVLRELGCQVDVYERSPELLDGRGAGVVLQPDTVRWFEEHGGIAAVEKVSTGSSTLRYLGPGNEIIHDEPSAWRFTSWTATYRALLDDFGTERYHLGEHVAGLDQDADQVTLRFVSGRRVHADLVVFADGISSTGRRRLLPEVRAQYSGYVGWRGTVLESAVSEETFELLHDSLAYSVGPSTHICMYPIPGPAGELEIGKRHLNYVWYRNVAEGPELDELLTDKRGFPCAVSVHPGMVQDRYVEELRAAARELLALLLPRSWSAPRSRSSSPCSTSRCPGWPSAGSLSRVTPPSPRGPTQPPVPRRPPPTPGLWPPRCARPAAMWSPPWRSGSPAALSSAAAC